MNFATYLDLTARTVSDRPAVGDPERDLTYREFAAETAAVADGFESLGIDPGDRVALFLPNSVLFTTTYFGAMKRGAIPVPINLRYAPAELEHVLADADPSVLVTVGELAEKIGGMATNVEHVIAAKSDQGIDYAELISGAKDSYEPYPRKNDELAEILYTSGTTGQPKGVQHTHGNLIANAFGTIDVMEPDQDGTYLTVVPCFHAARLNTTTTPAFVLGAAVRLLPEWDVETTLRTIERHSVNYSMFIPTMLLDVLEHGTEKYDLSSLEWVGVGGAPMPVERFDEAEVALDVKLYEGYGMTETTPLVAQNHPGQEEYKPGSIGTVIEQVADVRIEDVETRNPVGTNERGELLWRGDTVTPGYYNRPDLNEEAFVERDGLRWFRSGDIGRRDADGHLFIDDRIDDMIITGGENVYPREVEDVIYRIDGVSEVAVIGTPHERLREVVTAVVCGENVNAEEIEQVCREELSDFKIPRRIHFVEELPLTSTRKIDKVTLRERFDEEFGGEEIQVVRHDED